MRKFLVVLWYRCEDGFEGWANVDVKLEPLGKLTIQQIRDIEESYRKLHKWSRCVVTNIVPLES